MTTAHTLVPPRIGTIVARLPKLTETFIVGELPALGLPFELVTGIHEDHAQLQEDARSLDRRVHHYPQVSLPAAGVVLRWPVRSPSRWAGAWRLAIVGTIRSAQELIRAVATAPVATALGEEMVDLRVDRVHAHSGTHPTLAAPVIRNLTDLPSALTGHANDVDVGQTMMDRKVAAVDLVVRCAARALDALQSLSAPANHDKFPPLHDGVVLDVVAPTPLRTAAGALGPTDTDAFTEPQQRAKMVDRSARCAARVVLEHDSEPCARDFSALLTGPWVPTDRARS